MGAEGVAFTAERPGSMEHGDYATNAALAAGKFLKKNPKEVAENLKQSLDGKIAGIKKIEIAGAGFINFFLSREAIVEEIQNAATKKEWGTNDIYKGKSVMVEYTGSNPFKQFHIGHLMSNAIGESIARILEQSGAKVSRANYQGDVGPHVAKALFVLLEKNIANPTIEDISKAYVEGASRYEENPADKLAIDELNKKIYEKTDERVNAVYEIGRRLSLQHFEEIYQILGTKFDFYFFESETAQKGLEIVLARPNIFEQSEGATVFHGEKYGLHTRVFVNKLGLPTYEAKDMGLILEKQQRGTSDEYIYITASEQSEYFKVIFEAAKLVFPEIANKLVHRSHGMMRFASGKMASRKGNVVTGESLIMDLMEEAQKKMKGRELKDVHNVAQDVAVGAIKYSVLKQGSGKDIIFDPEKSLSLEGDSGPYVQYAHTRALSLIKASKKASIETAGESDFSAAGLHGDVSKSDSPAVSSRAVLERLLLHFRDALERSARELEPHYVTTYITELAAAFNSWYASERIIGGSNPESGVLLAKAIEQTLSKGLQVLGIPAPEEM